MRQLRTVSGSVPLLMAVFIVVLGAGWLSEAGAQVVLPDPELPPESNPPDCESLVSLYAGQGPFAECPGPSDQIVMSDARHRCFQNVIREAVGSDEHATFDSVLDAVVDFGLGPVPVTLTGPVTTVVYGKVGNTTGTFDTEIAYMSLSGDVGRFRIQLRESPTMFSQGSTAITDLGGGLYEIDSFFDVFTELSVDDGQTWFGHHQTAHMDLVPAEAAPVQSSTWGVIKSLFE